MDTGYSAIMDTGYRVIMDTGYSTVSVSSRYGENRRRPAEMYCDGLCLAVACRGITHCKIQQCLIHYT